MRPVIVSTAINETITDLKVKPFIVGGCSAAYSRSVHDITGPLDKNVIAEDFVYSFRALLGGGVQGIAEPLLMYRQNTASIMAKFKSGQIPEERLLKGEYAKLLEYKKALVAYAFNDPYILWRLNRRITTVELNIKANEAGVMGKFFILLRLVFTGRLRLFLKLSRQYYNIKKIEVPVLVIHGTKDKVVPYWMGKDVYSAGNEPRKLITHHGYHLQFPTDTEEKWVQNMILQF